MFVIEMKFMLSGRKEDSQRAMRHYPSWNTEPKSRGMSGPTLPRALTGRSAADLMNL